MRKKHKVTSKISIKLGRNEFTPGYYLDFDWSETPYCPEAVSGYNVTITDDIGPVIPMKDVVYFVNRSRWNRRFGPLFILFSAVLTKQPVQSYIAIDNLHEIRNRK